MMYYKFWDVIHLQNKQKIILIYNKKHIPYMLC